jgi:hypothetical protein
MLRYDACYPLDETAARGIGGESGGELITIYLQKWHDRKSDPRITQGRWNSFGWRVETERSDRTDMRLGTEKV